MTDGPRCPHCDRRLHLEAEIVHGVCRECGNTDYRVGDVVGPTPLGYLYWAGRDIDGNLVWYELAPHDTRAQALPPQDGVLLVRCVDGKPLPVVNLKGDLYAIEAER